MDKQQLAKSLRELADWIEKDSVQIKDVKINTQSGHVEGVDQETYTRTTYHPNGERYLDLDLHLYPYTGSCKSYAEKTKCKSR